MGFMRRYGTQWGAIPMTAGQVFWVAPAASYTVDGRAYIASDGNDGLSPERALLTIGRAIALATANVGDVIALLPGAHTTASAAGASKAGLTFVGLPYMPTSDGLEGIPPVSITGTGAIGVAVTAADNTFVNIKFVPVTQFQALTFTTAADRLRFKHCMVDMTGVTGHASTKGICATGATQAPRGLRIQGCLLKAGVATTSSGYVLDIGAATDVIMEQSTIFHDGFVASAAAWAVAVKINDGAQGVFRDNDWIAANVAVAVTKFVEAVAMTGAGTFQMFRNFTTVNTSGLLFDDFAAADVDLCNNYVATVAGGTGGTLITVTT
jgi:hypothetical protein